MVSYPDSLQVNELAYWVAENMNTIARDALYNSDTYKSLQQKHSVEGKPFVMQVSLIWFSRICQKECRTWNDVPYSHSHYLHQ